MDEVERLLQEAGSRWRDSQTPPRPIDPTALFAQRVERGHVGLLAAASLGAAGMLALVVAVGQAGLPGFAGGPPPTGTKPPVASATVTPSASVVPSPEPSAVLTREACRPTVPEPPFTAPRPYPASPPPVYQSSWWGTAALWTMLRLGGEVWPAAELPHDPAGYGQKTFWWSAAFVLTKEPEPAISVVGTRLDGPGTFTFDDSTNAVADFGESMLVGIDIPSTGCWLLTGRYRSAVLSYVVWVPAQ